MSETESTVDFLLIANIYVDGVTSHLQGMTMMSHAVLSFINLRCTKKICYHNAGNFAFIIFLAISVIEVA